MNFKTIKLNDLYYNINCYLESYYQTHITSFLAKAMIGYYWYKKRNGKKVIERLESGVLK